MTLLAHTSAMAEPFERLNSIVLDAGHGGPDRGAVSRNVMFEKDYAKKLALELKNLIFEQNGEAVTVTITGGGKNDTPQHERAAEANGAKGQLYISIHAASAFDQRSKELGIYILEDMRRGAIADSWKGANSIHASKNLKLGLALKGELDGLYQHKIWQLHHGRYVPLYGIDMPGVLIEMAALNDPRDQVNIAADGYFKEAARRIYNAIWKFDKGM